MMKCIVIFLFCSHAMHAMDYQSLESTNKTEINKIDGNGKTVLIEAIKEDNVQTVNALLSAGANPNTPNRRGDLPLCIAASYNKKNVLHIAELLLKHGASVNIKDSFRYTPFHYALDAKNDELITLLQDDVNMSITDREGTTGANKFVKYQNEEFLQLLARKAAEITNNDNNNKMKP